MCVLFCSWDLHPTPAPLESNSLHSQMFISLSGQLFSLLLCVCVCVFTDTPAKWTTPRGLHTSSTRLLDKTTNYCVHCFYRPLTEWRKWKTPAGCLISSKDRQPGDRLQFWIDINTCQTVIQLKHGLHKMLVSIQCEEEERRLHDWTQTTLLSIKCSGSTDSM